jgi:agmatine deiminase
MMLSGSPAALGFRMPAEWEPQEAAWLAWPHNEETWPGGALDEVRVCYGEILGALAPDQRVCLLVGDGETEEAVRRFLAGRGVDAGPITFVPVPTRDTWIRDYGPTFLVRTAPEPRLAMISWRFNAWGGKYADLEADDAVPDALRAHLDAPLFEAGLVLEGGSIEVNGQGLLLTTEQCLLHPNRNPGLDRDALGEKLRAFLGVGDVVWLGEGILGDDTDGHVDDIARFVDPDTVVCALEDDPADENYHALRDNLERLGGVRLRGGRRLRVIPLPMPRPVVDGGARLPASYANFYIGNRVVLVPTFADPADETALARLGNLFPGREVRGIDCRALVAGLGAIHCCTQQQPAV